MKLPWDKRSYDATVWAPTMGCIGDVFAYDTETTTETDPNYVKDVVIASTFQGDTVHFIRRQDLHKFWTVHAASKVYMHTAAFDINVTEKTSGFDFHPMIMAGRIVDISILWRLLVLATKGIAMPSGYKLDVMSDKLLHVPLNKDERIRCGFGQFFNGTSVQYQNIPTQHLIYAGQDAIATYELGLMLEDDAARLHAGYPAPLLQPGTPGIPGSPALYGPLSHHVQLRGDIALRRIERYGLGIDAEAVEVAEREVAAAIQVQKNILANFGYIPGRKGVRATYNRIMADIAARRGVAIPRCKKSPHFSQAADDLSIVADDEFVAAFLKYSTFSKLRSTYLAHLRGVGGRVHPHYSLLMVTGRSSCSSPNVQNLPREGKIRGCIVPAPGHVFIGCDYRMLELCTLAQITFNRYGQSRMRDLINQGVDLHVFTAAQILNKDPADITGEERRKAKAVGFGLPGGMGVNGLMSYAATTYDVILSPAEAATWRAQWLSLYPEMDLYLADEGAPAKLVRSMDLADYPAARIPDETIPAMILLRIAGGATATSKGRVFSRQELEWAWRKIAEALADHPKLTRQIAARTGSRDVQQALTPKDSAVTITGRIRAGCTYCEARNTPFQGAAADGAKIALYDLVRAGYRVVTFVHDEVLVEVPEAEDYRPVAEDISRIMIAAMKLICPDVTISTEYAVMRRWDKHAKALYDAAGRLIPYEPEEHVGPPLVKTADSGPDMGRNV